MCHWVRESEVKRVHDAKHEHIETRPMVEPTMSPETSGWGIAVALRGLLDKIGSRQHQPKKETVEV